jgi:hypothetical protein
LTGSLWQSNWRLAALMPSGRGESRSAWMIASDF